MLKTEESDINNLNILINTLEDYKNQLNETDFVHDKIKFFSIMQDFRKYLASIKDLNLCNLFYHSKSYNKYKTFFRERNYFYMRSVECVEAFSIMTKGIHAEENFSKLIDKEYIHTRYEKKINELRSLDFSKAETMVCVWCWPMPETILFIYENTDIENIIWIDNSSEAIYIAWEMIWALWLKNISLVHIDWEKYDFKDADIVYIPWFVYPKNLILDRIVKTWKKDVQILVDSSVFLQKMLFDDLWNNINQRLKIESITESSSLFYKQEMVKLIKYDF